MARNSTLFFLSLLLSCWNVATVSACRYTVRDVAFVDLGDMPYRLFVYANETANETERGELAAAVRKVAEDTLVDANAIIEFVDTSPETDHPALKYAAAVEDFPAVIAVGPEEETLILAEGLSADESTAAEQLGQLCETFVDSPTRREMFEKLLSVHSVILVVDGTDVDSRATTRDMVRQTIPQVEQSLEYLPKPIKEPPHMIHLTPQEAATEKVLLWALGMNPGPTEATQVALLFGRGRKLGPVLRFPEDPRRRFIQSLAVVGQDCECGLDRRWMQGPMVPHHWTTNDEKVAIEKLGFDPGNPLVKAEIDRILTRGPGSEGGRQTELEDSLKIAPALSYQEIALDDLVTEDTPRDSVGESSSLAPTAEGGKKNPSLQSSATAGPPSQILESELQGPVNTQSLGDAEGANKKSAVSPPGSWSYFFLIGSALVVVTIGLFILLRGGEAAA